MLLFFGALNDNADNVQIWIENFMDLMLSQDRS